MISDNEDEAYELERLAAEVVKLQKEAAGKCDECMNGIPDPYYKDGEGKQKFMEEWAIERLIRSGACFYGSIWHPDKPWGPKEGENLLGIGVCVSLNDVFYWACADCERLQWDTVKEVYDAYLSNPKWGTTIWGCKKRNLQPQVPMKEDMIKDGVWTPELEVLPEPEPS